MLDRVGVQLNASVLAYSIATKLARFLLFTDQITAADVAVRLGLYFLGVRRVQVEQGIYGIINGKKSFVADPWHDLYLALALVHQVVLLLSF